MRLRKLLTSLFSFGTKKVSPRISAETIEKICHEVLLEAKRDIVDMRWIRQIARDLSCDLTHFREILRCALLRIQTMDIVIGNTADPTGTYLEFIGWVGTPEEKVERALAEVENENSDGDYAAWLAYAKNVDYYETQSVRNSDANIPPTSNET